MNKYLNSNYLKYYKYKFMRYCSTYKEINKLDYTGYTL